MVGALQRIQAQDPEDPEEAGEDPAEEATESPDAEAAEEGQEGEGEGGQDGGAQGMGEEAPGSLPPEQAKQLFDLVVGRSLDALAKDAKGLDAALKADPVAATVSYGSKTLRAVAAGAAAAGKPIPFDILVQAGMQVVKEIAGIANEKGYLPDDQIEVFLKEAFQQSLAAYTKMDLAEGKIPPAQAQQLQQAAAAAQGGPGAAAGGGPPPGPGALQNVPPQAQAMPA